MACADDVEGAVEVTLDGTQGQAGDFGDLRNVHLFQEAQQEDGALAWRKGGDRLPDEGDLLLGDELGFGGALAIGDDGGDIVDVDGAGGDVLPEAEAAGAGVVAGQVEGDADEPGSDGAVLAEAGAGGPGAQEGFLGEGLGGVAVVQGGEQEAEDARLVEGDDGLEVVERRGASACAEGKAC